jgi:Domain of unknown function (DUF4850)
MSLVRESTQSASHASRVSTARRLRPWLGILALAFGCTKENATSNAGACQKDTDCKGERICEDAQCVSPSPSVVITSPVVSAGPASSLTERSGSQRSTVPRGKCAVTSGIKQGTDLTVSVAHVVTAQPELTSRLAVYTTDAGLSVLAPRSWNCVGTIGADGNETIHVSPPLTDPSKSGQEVSAIMIPACQGCIASLVCPLFPIVLKDWPGMDCEKSPPEELVMHPNATTAFFEDPPKVSGVGDPSGGPYPANGVLIYNAPNGQGGAVSAAKATCTLPESDHALCTVVLNDFLHK